MSTEGKQSAGRGRHGLGDRASLLSGGSEDGEGGIVKVEGNEEEGDVSTEGETEHCPD